MSFQRKFKSTNFFLATSLTCLLVIIMGLLEIFGYVPPYVFSAYLYAAMPTVSILALLHNILNARGLIEKSKFDKILMILTLTLGIIATIVVIAAWYTTFIIK